MAKKTAQVVSHLSIKVADAELSAPVRALLLEVSVDQHAYLPGMFTLRLQDPGLALLDKGPFELATAVEIAGVDQNNNRVILIKGEITALEPEFGEGMIAELVVRGYDTSHRLYREVKSMTFLNVKDSDLASQIAGAAKLKPMWRPVKRSMIIFINITSQICIFFCNAPGALAMNVMSKMASWYFANRWSKRRR